MKKVMFFVVSSKWNLKKISLFSAIMATFVVIGCTTNSEELTEKESLKTELKTSLSFEQYQQALSMFNNWPTTRSSEEFISEKQAEELLSTFISDGDFLQELVLDEDDLSDEERHQIENMTDGQKALASFLVNAMKYDYETMTRASSTECLTSGIMNAIGVGSIATWGTRKILFAVTVRGVCAGFGGVASACVLAAMTIKSYNDCMGGK